jgi:hypothetical protein
MIEDGLTGTLADPHVENEWLRAFDDFDPNSPKTRRQVEAAAARVRDHFDIAAIRDRHIAYFQKIWNEFKVETSSRRGKILRA